MPRITDDLRVVEADARSLVCDSVQNWQTAGGEAFQGQAQMLSGWALLDAMGHGPKPSLQNHQLSFPPLRMPLRMCLAGTL